MQLMVPCSYPAYSGKLHRYFKLFWMSGIGICVCGRWDQGLGWRECDDAYVSGCKIETCCLVRSLMPFGQLRRESRSIGCDPCIPFLHSSPNERLIPYNKSQRVVSIVGNSGVQFLSSPSKTTSEFRGQSNTSPRSPRQQLRAHDFRNHDAHPIQNSNILRPSNSIHPSESAPRQGGSRFHLEPYSQLLTWPLEINIPPIRLSPITTPPHLSRRSKQTDHPMGGRPGSPIMTPHSLVRENKQCSLAQLAGALNDPSIPCKAGRAGKKGCAVVSPAFLPADTHYGWEISLFSINGRAQHL